MANALAAETSPYLRQHAHNPVDWLPWGEQAFARARAQQKPLLVSIGYSACHWCHVMEHESFEDPRTAALMNERFVCVKVDREERPDVDALYMEAVQGMTGHGGWPLNVFLTPEQLPFYGGTYFPPSERAGMPSWTQVLNAVAESWSENSEQIRAGGERIRERLAGAAALRPSRARPDEAPLDEAVAALARSYDARHGGFGGAPKFPQASVIEFLLARGERPMALGTLHAMAAGGIHDQLGGGFARYSVDASWTVPHFEKMLYDNALLARAYLHGYQASGEERLREVCAQVLDWALREMRAPEGGFYSALDADSDGREGAFYVWTVEEIGDVLGEDAPAAIAWLGASERGNFSDPHHPRPGLNVLSDRGPRPPARLRESIRARLLAARGLRPRPALDDKRVTSWNALMIAALADAGTTLGAEPAGAEHGGADPTGAEHGGADPTGAEHGGADPTGAEHDSADPAGAEPGGARAAGPERPGTGQASGYLRAAVECAEFVLGELRDERGRLLRSYNDGRARIDAFLEDYAFMVEALIALFEASCDQRWLDEAVGLAREMIARFADTEGGGFFSTAADGEELIARRKELEDSPIPSGSSSAALGLLRLAQLTGEQEFELRSDSVLALLAEIAPRHPTAFGHLLQALHWRSEPARPIACELPGPHPSPAPLRGSTGSGPAPSGSPGLGSPPTPGA